MAIANPWDKPSPSAASEYELDCLPLSSSCLATATVQAPKEKMEVILDRLDPVLLDDIYSSARQLAATICANRTAAAWQQLPRSSSVIDQTKQRLCDLATDPSLWQRHGLCRQSISIFLVTWLSSSLFYLLFGTICYYHNFDRSLKKQPKFRPNQIRSDMADSLWALLILNVLTVPIFVAQVRGLARIYAFGTGSACFVIPTPFSALPVYAYSFIWPMSDVGQLIVFFVTNIWTFLLHHRDQFHTVHHKSIQLNFGQFSALWDKLGGTYADPEVFFKPVRDKRERERS
ncbi:hypothetical protein C8A01DRAFT_45072 [Parachaetomium inaequale]|uniref:Uncharacterized protein n=1 Tax=Parachaetomium inaequale TaxID=2588326 RepID=A0AAN6PN19_9PEZI|nr:hypothetical protein C8A01DRAFT_45072 [Parachaetomium inaequale]